MGGIGVGGKVGGRRGRKGRAVRSPRKIELAVRKELVDYVTALNMDIEGVQNILLTGTPTEVNAVLRQMQEKWRSLYGNKSETFTRKWVGAVSARNKEEFQKNISRSLGVDYTAVFDDELVYTAAEFATLEASHLIRTIPEEYFGKIQEAVMQNYQQLPLPEGRSLIEEIQHIYGVTKERARVIARDQTSKINIAITQARNEEIGIEEYIWRTAGDSRVVGTPGGLYPSGNRVHGNHYVRNGNKFRWDSPPADGHPGYAINCRCVAEPVIDIDKLKFV